MTHHAPTILVVEDEAPIAAAIAARLRSEGFHVVVAPDGRIALELCRRVRPDLIVLDLMLRRWTGSRSAAGSRPCPTARPPSGC